MKNILILSTLCLISSVVFADEIVTTKGGKKINLKDDGTWEVISKKQIETKNTKTAIATVNEYLKVNKWQDRIKFVLDPDRVKPLMDELYGKIESWEKPTFKMATKNEPAQVKIDDYVTINAMILKKTQSFRGTSTDWDDTRYYLQKTVSGYKIDWESSVGYNEMTVAAFHATKPSDSVRFRLSASLSPIGIAMRNDVYNLRLKHNGQVFFGGCYVAKNSDAGEKIYNTLKDGYEHYMVLNLKYEDYFNIMVQDVISTNSWVINSENLN